MRTIGYLLVLAGVLAASAGDATVEAAPTAVPPVVVPPVARPTAEPPPLDVRCAADGVSVSGTTVRAGGTGVRLRVAGTAPAGTYLHIAWHRGGQGDPVPAVPTVRVLSVPPGEMRLSCSNVEQRDVAVTVADPAGHWRPGVLADWGCEPAGIVSWAVGPGRGRTAEAALADLARQVREGRGRPTAWREVPIGYPAGPVATWLLSVGGEPLLTASVRQIGTSFEAVPEMPCRFRR